MLKLVLDCSEFVSKAWYGTDFKNAVVCPRLKKEWLDASQLKNYRPVLNLSFLSNLLERVVQVKTSGLSR